MARPSAGTSGSHGTASAASIVPAGSVPSSTDAADPVVGAGWRCSSPSSPLLPLGFESGYVRRVAFDTIVYMLLALGLNVVVGGVACSTSATSRSSASARTRTPILARTSSTSTCRRSLLIPSIACPALLGFLVGAAVETPGRVTTWRS